MTKKEKERQEYIKMGFKGFLWKEYKKEVIIKTLFFIVLLFFSIRGMINGETSLSVPVLIGIFIWYFGWAFVQPRYIYNNLIK